MDAIVFYLSSALLGYLMLRKFFKRAPEEEPAVELEERVVLPLTVEKGTQTDELFHGPIMRVEEDSVSSDELVLEDYIKGC